MTDNKQPAFAITGQYIKDMSFEAPGTPRIFTEMNNDPKVEINVDVEAKPFENNLFEVALTFHIKSTFGGQTGFIMELIYCGVVSIHLPQDQVQPALLIEAPRMMFPFARNIVADITRDSGFPALMIQPIDFVQMYNQRMKEMNKAPAKTTTTEEAKPAPAKKAPAKKTPAKK